MTKDEALDLALKALERLDGWLVLRYGSGLTPQEQQDVTAIKQALAAPVHEPVAWMDALKDAFFEGFTSAETYNDILLNSPEEAWAKYKPPVTLPAASVRQEPVGRVVSANCEYATVQWLRQTSEVGGGDPKNARSWPIAGDAVYTTPPAQPSPVQEPVAWHDKIIGMEVSMDVSTGDDDIDHRVYGQVYEVMLAYDGGPDVIFAIESERNFTTPPAAQRQWVGLTQDEFRDFASTFDYGTGGLIRAIEAKLKEKNT